ncbi:hypothetical protein ACN24K_27780 [Streptomyces microflavus]
MFRADERGHTIFNEQCRELDMQGVLGPGACTAIFFNPRRLNLVRDWSGDRGPHFVLPPTAITLKFPEAGPDASPFNVVSFHFAYASAEQRQLEAEWTTTWADKGWQAPDGSRHVLPAIFGGDGNSYPEPGTAGDLPLADLSAIQDRPHRLHRSRRGPDGVRVPDTEPDHTLRTAGLEDVARYWAEKGNPAALARTVDATETRGPHWLQSLANAKCAINRDLSVDSTVCRAHQHATVVRRQRRITGVEAGGTQPRHQDSSSARTSVRDQRAALAAP